MEKIIEVSGLKKSFGRIEALKGIDCSYERGGVISILGPNASGKTDTHQIHIGHGDP